jgi:hypothetical protein
MSNNTGPHHPVPRVIALLFAVLAMREPFWGAFWKSAPQLKGIRKAITTDPLPQISRNEK